MVWFYERQGTFIRCETRVASSGSGFELVVIQPDGSERVEHFDDSRRSPAAGGTGKYVDARWLDRTFGRTI